MAEVVSLEEPVEIVDGDLVVLIPLEAGGDVLAPLAKGIGEVDGEFLKVVIQPWLFGATIGLTWFRLPLFWSTISKSLIDLHTPESSPPCPALANQ